MTDSPEHQPTGRTTAVSVERLIDEQRRIMRKQLELLRRMQDADDSTAASPIELPSPVLPRSLRATGVDVNAPTTTETRRVPLTDIQRDMWITCQLSGAGSTIWNLSYPLRLEGDLDIDTLREAVRLLVHRHESLRTTFDPSGDYQHVHSDIPTELAFVDISDRPGEVQARVEAYVDLELTAPYDLEAGPLFRSALLRLGDRDHMLVLSAHHLVTDGYSFGLLQRDLGAIYSGLVRGEERPLEEATQFSEYVAWRNAQGPESEPFWLDLYRTPPVQLELPADRARPPERTFEFGWRRATIDAQLYGAVRELARNQGVTTFTVLLAAWEILLHRLSGQSEFASGVAVAGQATMGAGDLVGLCTGLLPLQVRVDRDEPLRDYLVRRRRSAAEAIDHMHVGVGQLTSALGLTRDASRSALVSTAMTYETPAEGVTFAGLAASEWVHGRRPYGAFDLEAYLTESEDHLLIDFQYAATLFLPETIDRWLGHYRYLLEQMAASPTATVSDLRLLQGAEDQERLTRWNDTAHPYPDDTVVHRVFDAQAERTPDATALIHGTTTFTFAEVRDRSNRLAHRLVEMGVRVGVPVGVVISRSPDMIVGMLAVLKAGGAYLPLDPAYPAERLVAMVDDAELDLILSGPEAEAFPATRAELLDVQAFDGSAYPSTSPDDGTTPDDPMFVTFTSGSAGRPKGVLGTHRGMLNRFDWQWQTYPFSEGEVCCQKTSLNFVDHLWETWGPLLRGHALVIVPDEVFGDPGRFIDLLEAHRIERLVIVPALMSTLLRAVPDMGTRLSALRLLTLSGERLTNELAAEIETALPGCALLNFYGMSEASADVTWYDRRWGHRGDSFPIGRPIHNMQVYLLDVDRQPVPVGETGEIYVGGVGLAAGYLGRPELTAERFLPNPFVDDADARMYRTGDLGRWLPDGLLEFVGRVDDQVKVRGIRIELGELESAIRSLADVQEAAVIAPEVGGDRQLVAYVTLAGEDSVAPSAVREALAAVLPGYMVPSRIVILDQFPLTSTGKIDRRSLPDPVAERPSRALVAPRTETESTLAGIWARLLSLPKVGIEDNFFDLGGDSLTAMRFVMEANRSGIGLAPYAIFRYQTIAELASAAAVTTVAADDQGVVTGHTPLSPAQLRFLEERRTPDAHHWNVSTLEAADRLDPAPLQVALEAIILHHDSLRLRVWREDGRWRQEIAGPPDALPFVSHDVSHLPPAERRAEIERICTDLQGSMDLEEGLLIRVAHFSCGPDAPDRLFVAVHHFAVDGMTWPLLMEDLEQAYRQAESGSSVSLPPKTTSIKAWATQLERLVQTPAVVDVGEAWLRLPWRDVARLPMDFDHGAAANTNASAAAIEVELGAEETQWLLEGAERPQHVIITALAACLSDWTGSPTVLIDVLGHGRDVAFHEQNLTRTLGFTLSYNPLVLSDPAWDMSRATVASVGAQIDAEPDGYTFELLRFMSTDPEMRARLTALPRADVLFNYRGARSNDDDSSSWHDVDEPSGPDASPRGLREHPIAVRASLAPNLQLLFVYSTALHRAQTVEAKAAEVVESIRRLSGRAYVA